MSKYLYNEFDSEGRLELIADGFGAIQGALFPSSACFEQDVIFKKSKKWPFRKPPNREAPGIYNQKVITKYQGHIYNANERILKIREILEKHPPNVKAWSIVLELHALHYFNHKHVVYSSITQINPGFGSSPEYFLHTERAINLTKFRHKVKTVTDEQIAYVEFSVFKALAYLKARDFVHNKIAPPNVVINHYGIVKLANFEWMTFEPKDRDTRYLTRMDDYEKHTTTKSYTNLYENVLNAPEEMMPFQTDVFCAGMLAVYLKIGRFFLDETFPSLVHRMFMESHENILSGLGQFCPEEYSIIRDKARSHFIGFLFYACSFKKEDQLCPLTVRHYCPYFRDIDEDDFADSRISIQEAMSKKDIIPPPFVDLTAQNEGIPLRDLPILAKNGTFIGENPLKSPRYNGTFDLEYHVNIGQAKKSFFGKLPVSKSDDLIRFFYEMNYGTKHESILTFDIPVLFAHTQTLMNLAYADFESDGDRSIVSHSIKKTRSIKLPLSEPTFPRRCEIVIILNANVDWIDREFTDD